MLRAQCTRRSQPGQSCQLHLPEGSSLLCLPGTCLHFPAQLETVQGWMELGHSHRATICSGFPRLNLSFCLEIECRWDFRSLGHPLWLPGKTTTVHEETSTGTVIWEIPDRNMTEPGIFDHTALAFLRKRRAINSRDTLEKPCQSNTALRDLLHHSSLTFDLGICTSIT